MRDFDQGLVEKRAAGDAGAHGRVEVGLRPGPVGGVEPVFAVRGHQHCLDAGRRPSASSSAGSVGSGEQLVGHRLGEVLLHEPPVDMSAGSQVRITTRPATRCTSARPARQFDPVVDREDGQRGIERAVARRAGARPPRGRRARTRAVVAPASRARARGPRRPGRPSRRSRSPAPMFTIRRASPSADADLRLDPRIGAAGRRVRRTDHVIARAHGSSNARPDRATGREVSFRAARPCKDHRREDWCVGGNRTGGQGLGGPARRCRPRGAGRIA